MRIPIDKKKAYLETLVAGDAEGIAEQANDAELAQNVAGMGEFPHPYRIDDAMMFIAGAAEELDSGRGYHFGIKTYDGKIAGAAGIRDMDRESHTGEIGFWVGKTHRGQGLASGAMDALVAFGFEELALREIFAEVLASNQKSILLLSKLGFMEREKGTARLAAGGVSDTSIMSLTRDQYYGLKNAGHKSNDRNINIYR